MNLTQSTALHLEGYQDLHLSVDFERETALLDGTRMKLTYKAFALLALLVRHPGQLIPRDTLLLLVWGYGADIRTRTLDVHIRHLRKSLGSYGNAYIETVFGVGYRLQPCAFGARNAGHVTRAGIGRNRHRQPVALEYARQRSKLRISFCRQTRRLAGSPARWCLQVPAACEREVLF